MDLKRIESINIPLDLEKYDHFLIAGVKVHGDPYVPLDTVFVIPDRVGRVRGFTGEVIRENVFISVVAFVKEFGELPKGAIINVGIWGKMLMDEIEKGEGHRFVYDPKGIPVYQS